MRLYEHAKTVARVTSLPQTTEAMICNSVCLMQGCDSLKIIPHYIATIQRVLYDECESEDISVDGELPR
jgi:hypothetical protein